MGRRIVHCIGGAIRGTIAILFTYYMQHFHHDIDFKMKSIFKITSKHVTQ